MEIRDTIHGLIEYDPTEERIINSQVFQRLRGIKQLALTNYVYPGACHTRFEHSLGVMHLAGRVAKKLGLQEKTLRLGGLLHDVGHGPFSHVSEQIITKYVDKNILNKYKAENAQELLTILIIENNKEIKKILSKDELDSVKSLIQKDDKRYLERDIISGPLDVDKFDYLLRDSRYAGVNYGIFDLEKVIESLSPIKKKYDEQLGIKEQGVYSVEQLLLARYHMNVQVYHHRVRRITDAMLIRGIEFALEEGLEYVENIYKFRDDEEYLDNFIKSDDEKTISSIVAQSDDWSGKLFGRISERKIFKEILKIDVDNKNFDDPFLLKNALSPSKERIDKISIKIAEDLKVERETVILDIQHVSNPTFKMLHDPIDTSDIIVVSEVDNKKKSFCEVSSIFNNPTVGPKKEVIHIYAPLDDMSRDERNKFRNDKRDEMIDIVKEGLI